MSPMVFFISALFREIKSKKAMDLNHSLFCLREVKKMMQQKI